MRAHITAGSVSTANSMDDALPILILMFVLGLLIAAFILPVVALVFAVRARRISESVAKFQNLGTLGVNATQPTTSDLTPLINAMQRLTARVDRLEKLQSGLLEQLPLQIPAAPIPPSPPPVTPPPPAAPPPPMFTSATEPTRSREQLESIVGRRGVGWAAVVLIILAGAFFLKYAFDNRWIGELGRVAIGVITGVSVTLVGFRYHKRGWRIFSQLLTACGIVLLYLSVYAAFGYYHLASQKAAFVYLTILIIEAGLLALLYNAPAIAVMAVIGGFLAPILLRSDRDQYRSLFSYLLLLDVGTLALFRRWPGLASLAYAGTQFLFWLWWGEHYHPRKRSAVLLFQGALLLIYLLTHIAKRIFTRESDTPEDLALILISPFIFSVTAYALLNPDYHDWMGVFAIGMGLLYAGIAKVLLTRSQSPRIELLVLMGISLTFVTLAIPIQLKGNWITIGWSVEALLLLWASIEVKSEGLRSVACSLFGLAILKLVFWDTPWLNRPTFTPVLNKYFLCSLVVIGCLAMAAAMCRKLTRENQMQARLLTLGFTVAGIGVLWFLLSVEIFTLFNMRAHAQETIEDFRHEKWLGQMALSVFWSLYASLLAAVGFVRRSSFIRWIALGLFAVTTVKVMLLDIAVLERLYRIIAFFVLGLLLLLVAWGYHKAFHARESSK